MLDSVRLRGRLRHSVSVWLVKYCGMAWSRHEHPGSCGSHSLVIAMDTVPAEPSSSVPAALTQLTHADPLLPVDVPDLLAYLATVGDPRRASGRWHPLVAILAMAAAAVLAGARSMTAIAESTADTPQPVLAALGARRDAPTAGWCPPSHHPPDPRPRGSNGAGRGDRRVACRRDRPAQRRRVVAVDGNTLRGVKRDGRQVHLLAAMDHATRRRPRSTPSSPRCAAQGRFAQQACSNSALRSHANHHAPPLPLLCNALLHKGSCWSLWWDPSMAYKRSGDRG
jgi:hypothetical protein